MSATLPGVSKAWRIPRRAGTPKTRSPDPRPERINPVVAVNPENLAPYHSYGDPDFVMRGFYLDREFHCRECGRQETWTARQ